MGSLQSRPDVLDQPGDDSLACDAKLAFDSQKAANAAATTLGYQRGLKLKAYKCADCSLWHLASKFDA